MEAERERVPVLRGYATGAGSVAHVDGEVCGLSVMCGISAGSCREFKHWGSFKVQNNVICLGGSSQCLSSSTATHSAFCTILVCHTERGSSSSWRVI